MAARRPAPPPPTRITSCEGVTVRPRGQESGVRNQRSGIGLRLYLLTPDSWSLTPESGVTLVLGFELVRQDFAVVADHPAGNAAVVVLVADDPAAAGVDELVAD